MGKINIIDTNATNILDYGVCGYKNPKKAGYKEKIDWLKERYNEGLKIKILKIEDGGTQGMIEYLPGEYCWRPVDARGYMFIHCIFVGFRRIYKDKGYGALMLEECLKDAESQNMHGVAVVTRDSSFMVGKKFFLKNGFQIVEKANPDFQLMVKTFDEVAPMPKFTINTQKLETDYAEGLTIIRADQCPYSVKNVNEICEVAEKTYHITPNLVNLSTHKDAQNTPAPFGTFCIIYNGNIVAHHPISKRRFMNIMEKELE